MSKLSTKLIKGKKGIGGETIVLVAAIFAILAIFIMFSFITGIKTKEVKAKIDTVTEDIEDQISFLSYLRTEVNGKTVSDLIAESYIRDDYSELKGETSDILDNAYGKKMKWSIFINGELKIEDKGASEKTSVINSEMELPVYGVNTIKFKLIAEPENE